MTCACPGRLARAHDMGRTFAAFVEAHVRAEIDGDDPAALDPLLEPEGDRRYAVEVSLLGATTAHRLAHMIGHDDRVQHLRPAQVLAGSALIMISGVGSMTDRDLDDVGDVPRGVVHDTARFVAGALIAIRGPDDARRCGRALIESLVACETEG